MAKPHHLHEQETPRRHAQSFLYSLVCQPQNALVKEDYGLYPMVYAKLMSIEIEMDVAVDVRITQAVSMDSCCISTLRRQSTRTWNIRLSRAA